MITRKNFTTVVSRGNSGMSDANGSKVATTRAVKFSPWHGKFFATSIGFPMGNGTMEYRDAGIRHTRQASGEDTDGRRAEARGSERQRQEVDSARDSNNMELRRTSRDTPTETRGAIARCKRRTSSNFKKSRSENRRRPETGTRRAWELSHGTRTLLIFPQVQFRESPSFHDAHHIPRAPIVKSCASDARRFRNTRVEYGSVFALRLPRPRPQKGLRRVEDPFVSICATRAIVPIPEDVARVTSFPW